MEKQLHGSSRRICLIISHLIFSSFYENKFQMNPLHPPFWVKIGLLWFSLYCPWSVFAVETFPMDQEHHGVINLLENNNTNTNYCKYCSGTYQIFPEKRMGNALYFQSKLLVSFANRQILDLFEIRDAESLVYLYADNEQKLAIGLYDFSADKQTRIKRVDDEFYQVWNAPIYTRAIFRIYQNRLERVASHLRTVAGVTPSRSHVAYYHIAKSELITENEKEVRVFDFSVHVLKRSAAKPRRLDINVRDTQPALKLFWVNAQTLRYYLGDGTSRDVNAAALLPDYF